MLPLMKHVLLVFAALGLSACASNGLQLSASQCAADWRSVGVADGRDGAPESKINEYRSACAASAPLASSDIEAWRRGWADGADIAYDVAAADGVETHDHAHSHEGAHQPHERDPHEHKHPAGFPVRALVIGLVHGAAGSGGLLALAAAATQDAWTALAYVLLFGVGSTAGMAALSFVAAWPLGWAEKGARWLYRGATLAAAATAIVIGASVMWETGPLAWALF